ncbi:MAG: tetratricopeptide repeat protein [Deltaproteobacteria bacterium]|nr:tetratricopeptide repeat protein [Deltaproteobacteria bacterium]
MPPPPGTEGRPSPFGRTFWVGVVLVVLTVAVYGQTVQHGFISFDDDDYITNNDVVQRGLTWEGFLWAFSAPHVYNWHPLTWLSHMLDVQLFGLDAGGHHLMSLLFHLANTLLLFIVLRSMTGALWRSGFVAALFALHPLHVESVAWVAERKDVLSTLFWMLTLWCYLAYVRKPGLRRYWPVLLCFALGLLAKQMAVTLPFVLLLLDYWPLKRLGPEAPGPFQSKPPSEGRPPVPRPDAVTDGGPGDSAALSDWRRTVPLIREKLPLFALAAMASVLIYLVQAETGLVKSAEAFPLSVRLENALYSYAAYLFKAFLPVHLAVFYPHPGTALPLWKAAGAAALLLLITALVLWRRKAYLAVGWFWYLGTLVPVIGLVQVGLQGMADRYTYIPLIGIFIMAAWGIPELVARWPSRKVVLPAAAVAVIAALAIMTWFQAGTWRSNVALYRHAVEVTTGNAWAEYNLGLALTIEGRQREAVPHFQEAIRLKPGNLNAILNLGAIQAGQRDFASARASFNRVLELSPGHAEALKNLSLLLIMQDDLAEAAARLQTLRRVRPDSPEGWFLTGLLDSRRGKPADAEADFRRAINLRLDYAEAHTNLAILLAEQGRLKEAIVHFREAVRIRPDDREAARNLEMALGEAKTGR